ncbi:mucin-2-like [Sycon ciliatum]|uniref:mucin-2-like n=1 Tax=Sycon ciliatum TaxID=27933 RepID=UPI0031F70B27
MNRIPAHLTSGGDYDVVPPNATTAQGAQGTNTTGQMAANGEAENEYDVALPPTAAKPGADPAGDTYDTFTFNTEPTGEGPDPSTYDHIGKVLPNAAAVTSPASASPAVPKPDVYSTVDSTNLAPQAPALVTTPTQPPPDATQGTTTDNQLPSPNLESLATDSPAPPRDVYSMVDPTKKKRNK